MDVEFTVFSISNGKKRWDGAVFIAFEYIQRVIEYIPGTILLIVKEYK